ncbi:MAG TPA: hypothetical protein VMH40_03045 [Myxococcaceae bacterium]|nr:hypothetical protein [Myxococcaceae bacterium]
MRSRRPTEARPALAVVPAQGPPLLPADPEPLVRTCLNCGAVLEERKCKLFCRCGYYASCSDFL